MHNPIQKISLLIYEGLASLRYSRSWLPLFTFWLLNALGLILFSQFAALPGAGWMAVWLGSLFGREALEYPRFFLELPDIQRKLYLVLAVTIGLLFIGTSLLYLLRYHTRGQVGHAQPWRRSLQRMPGHFVINLLSLSLFLLPLLALRIWAPPALSVGTGGKLLLLAVLGLGLIAQVFLLYAPLIYLIHPSGIRESVRASLRFGRQHFWVSTGLGVIPFLLAAPLQGVQSARRAIVEMFRPELILWLLLLTSLVTLLILYLQLSMLVRFYSDEALRQPYRGEWPTG